MARRKKRKVNRLEREEREMKKEFKIEMKAERFFFIYGLIIGTLLGVFTNLFAACMWENCFAGTEINKIIIGSAAVIITLVMLVSTYFFMKRVVKV